MRGGGGGGGAVGGEGGRLCDGNVTGQGTATKAHFMYIHLLIINYYQMAK